MKGSLLIHKQCKRIARHLAYFRSISRLTRGDMVRQGEIADLEIKCIACVRTCSQNNTFFWSIWNGVAFCIIGKTLFLYTQELNDMCWVHGEDAMDQSRISRRIFWLTLLSCWLCTHAGKCRSMSYVITTVSFLMWNYDVVENCCSWNYNLSKIVHSPVEKYLLLPSGDNPSCPRT